MAIDRPQYIKLYEIAMEEVRHHHRLYTEIWLSSFLMTSVFFGGLYFLSSAPPLAFSTPFMCFMIIFGSIVIGAFYWQTMRRGEIASICRETAKNLEDILVVEIPEEAIETKPLLLTRAIEARQKKKLCFLWQVLCKRKQWLVFPVVLIPFWIYLCVTVFITCG